MHVNESSGGLHATAADQVTWSFFPPPIGYFLFVLMRLLVYIHTRIEKRSDHLSTLFRGSSDTNIPGMLEDGSPLASSCQPSLE
jgi:hypothetical protein